MATTNSVGNNIRVSIGTSLALSGSNSFISVPNSTTSTNGVVILGTTPYLNNRGTNNTFIGGSGNFTFTTGSAINNTCVGLSSGAAISTTSNSTFVGYQSGQVVTNGARCVAVGALSLQLANDAQDCVALGYGALQNVIDGSSCIAIGSLAGSPYSSIEDSNISIGTFGLSEITGENGAIRIGNSNPSGTLSASCYIAGISGATFSAGSPTPAYVIIDTSDGQLISSATPPVTTMTITTVTNAASPYTVLAADQFLSCVTSGGVITVLLPNAPTTGRVIYVKDFSGAAATSNITVTTVGGAVNIDGATTYTLNVNYQSIGLIFDGSAYEVF